MLSNRTRFLIIILLSAMLFLVFAMSIYAKELSVKRDWIATRKVICISVENGETMWSIAEEYAPSFMRSNLWDYIDCIMKLNGKKTTALFCGESLYLYA